MDNLRQLRSLGFHFRRQSPIDCYIVDFECRKSRLVVEVDGGQQNHDANAVRDQWRDKRLQDLGYLILRFWNHDVDCNTDGVMETIHVHLLDRQPHPTGYRRSPSPEGEG